jgi:hypothetical protein
MGCRWGVVSHAPGVPLIFDHASAPPDGYTFKDPAGVTLTAPSLRELPPKVASFRASNGLPPGNPHAEIEADYRVRYPWLVSKVGLTPATPEDPVSRWLNRAWRSPVKERDFADSQLTEERLLTCAGCSHRVQTHAYSPESRRRLTILGCGRVTDTAVCSVHHWPVGLAAMHSEPETAHQVDGCWAGMGIVP